MILHVLRMNTYRWIVIAGLWHVVVAVTVYLISRWALLPHVFDTKGIGIAFHVDSSSYLNEAISLCEILRIRGFSAWFNAPSLTHTWLHVKLYSLCLAVCGPLIGYNTLALEPLNLLYFLLILSLLYQLGRMIGGHRSGLLSCIVVALWPSFLLHTTQLPVDLLFITSMLALLLITVKWLTQDQAWYQIIVAGSIAIGMSLLLWLARPHMWNVVRGMVFLAVCMLLLRTCIRMRLLHQVQKGRMAIGNLLGGVLLLTSVWNIPYLLPATTVLPPWKVVPSTELMWKTDQFLQDRINSAWQRGRSPAVISQLSPAPMPVHEPRLAGMGHNANSIGLRRDRFIHGYKDGGSNIDLHVKLHSTADILLYLPRAMVIGFFAPFPNMWIVPGRAVGYAGRLLAGLEMLMVYGVWIWVLLRFWRRPRTWLMWYLLLCAGLGMIGLGLVVTNVGAIYRMRYLFLMLLLPIAASEMARRIPVSLLEKLTVD